MQELNKITADWIFDGLGNALKNHLLVLDNQGFILELRELNDSDKPAVTYYKGGLCPGFINAHCHLELSHLKEAIDTGTGLLEFLKKVVTLRAVDKEIILKRIEQEDQSMYDQGIVAVGDISNGTDTVLTKGKSKIQYFTFVEVFDFCQDNLAEANWESALQVYKEMPGVKSIVAHSPYTVSNKLFELISSLDNGGSSSIHNQEMKEENNLHSTGSEELKGFLNIFGFNYPEYIGGKETAMDFVIEKLRVSGNLLLVHNTQSSEVDIRKAQHAYKNCFWVTCPNANLYIENKLPDYKAFVESSAQVCIGTDSLSSNWKLSVLEEIKTIKKYNSWLSTKNIIKWATYNGAKALGFDEKLGSFENGKSPGINHLTSINSSGELNSDCRVNRIM